MHGGVQVAFAVGVRVGATVRFARRRACVRVELLHVGLGASLALHGQGVVERGILVPSVQRGGCVGDTKL